MLTLVLIIVAQFILSAYLNIPLHSKIWRQILLWLFFIANFILFREIVVQFTPGYIIHGKYFEANTMLLFLLSILGRNIRQYEILSGQMEELKKWSIRKTLFDLPNLITIHLGEAGEQEIHPNEILYIRTKQSGDHTKIFGIKSRVNGKFREYTTQAYQNFTEIGLKLLPYPQFKRINRSTMVNHMYPFEEREGVLIIEGRRFRVHESLMQAKKR